MMDSVRPTCRRLPQDVVQAIRSHTAISSPSHCVEELILNSLDAEATAISITVNLSTFRIKVDDNGIGISPADLAILGTRYTTSKCKGMDDLRNLRYYGYRGEALTNIVQLSSSIEIYTRQDEVVHARKIKANNSSEHISKVSLAKKPTRGTIVVVNNFMSKTIVRQKMIDPILDMEEIRSRVEAIALVNPRVAILLKNEANNNNLLQVNSCISTKDVFKQLQGTKYQMGKHVLLEISHQYDAFYFSAFASNELAQFKNCQHFFVNKRLVDRCHFSRLLNKLLGECIGIKSKRTSLAREDSIDKKKYPVFIVNVQCPVDEYDMTFEPRKHMVAFRRKQVLIEAIESLVKRFRALLTSEGRSNDKEVVERAKEPESSPFSREVGKSITTHAIKRAVHSRPVVRERKQSSYFPHLGGINSKLYQDIRKNFAPFRADDSSKRKKLPFNAFERLSPVVDEEEQCRRLQFNTPDHTENVRGRLQFGAPIERRYPPQKYKGIDKNVDPCAGVTNKLHNMSFSASPVSTLKSCLSESPISIVSSGNGYPTTHLHKEQGTRMDERMSQEVSNSQQEKRPQKRHSQRYEGSQFSQHDSQPRTPTTPSPNHKKKKSNTLERKKVESDVYRLTTEGLREKKLMLIGPSYKTRLQKRATFLLGNGKRQETTESAAAGGKVASDTPKWKEVSNDQLICPLNPDEKMDQTETKTPGDPEQNICSYFLPSELAVGAKSVDMCDYLGLGLQTDPSKRVSGQCEQDKIFGEEGLCRASYFGLAEALPKNQNEELASAYFCQPQEGPSDPAFNLNEFQTSFFNNPVDFDKGEASKTKLDRMEESNWEHSLECRIVTDAKGQDWLESRDPDTNQLKYVNLKQGGDGNIIRSSTKLTPNEIALLGLNQSTTSLPVPVYGFQKKYFDNGVKNLSRDGNMDLLAAGKTLFSDPIKELIGAASALQNTKWRFPDEAKIASLDDIPCCESEQSEYFSEPWRSSVSTTELPLANLASNEVNLCRLDKDIVFTKEDLANVHVIGQLDNKFIIGRLTHLREEERVDVLVLFDQHAVHERIRLEMLLEDVYVSEPGPVLDGKRKQVLTVNVKPPIALTFNEAELRILKNYTMELQLVGLFTETFIEFCSIHINKIPKCFVEKISNETMSSRDETISKLTYALIQEQLSYILDAKQQSRGLPKTIFNLLCSQACHGAIKFGDNLTLEVCQDLIKSLEKCQLPFQCAHGRPAVIPLINL